MNPIPVFICHRKTIQYLAELISILSVYFPLLHEGRLQLRSKYAVEIWLRGLT